jgi:integrase
MPRTTTTRRGNNEGSIVSRPGGKIQARVTVGFKDDGSLDRISKTFCDNEKTLAREWIADQISAMGRGVNLSARNTSWKELQDQWLATKKATLPKTADTYQKYHYAAKHIPWTIEPAKDCVQRVQPLINELSHKMASSSIRNVYAVLRGVMELAMDKDIIFKMPKIKLPALEERIPVMMSFAQIAFLLQATEKYESKYAFGLWLELGTGLRRSEMLALDCKDIDIEKRTIPINKKLIRIGNKIECVLKTKTKAGTRLMDVPQVIIDAIAPHTGTGKLFQTDTGEYLSPSNWSRLFRAWRKRADVLIAAHNKKTGAELSPVSTVRFHDLRHQFASFMHELGIAPKTTQQMTGHSDIDTLLQRYTHVTPEQTKAASEKLNELLRPLIN